MSVSKLEPDLRKAEKGDEADLTDDEQLSDTECSNISNKKVIVVGAGVAGISAALFLKKHNIETIILEGRDRIGGRIFTDYHTFSAPVDLGASIITGTDPDPTGKSACDPCGPICRAFGLGLHFLDSQSLPLYHEHYQTKPIPKPIDTQSASLFDKILDLIAESQLKEEPPTNEDKLTSLGTMFFQHLKQHIQKNDSIQSLNDMPTNEETTSPIVLKQKRSSDLDQNKEIKCEKDPSPASKKLKITCLGQEDVVLELITPSPSPQSCLDIKPKVENSILLNGKSGNDEVHMENSESSSEAKIDVLMWHKAHLEYGCGTSLADVSSLHWNQDEVFGGFNGRHAVVKGGLAPFVEILGTDLDIRLEKVVGKIEYGPEGVQVFTQNGECFDAGVVICTVPLGVLKTDLVCFDPPLPSWKQQAIEHIGFGNLNKVILEFSSPFWDNNIDYFGVVPHPLPEHQQLELQYEKAGFCFMFNTSLKFTGKSILTGVISGQMANQIEEMPEESVITMALNNLSQVFGPHIKDLFLRGKVTNWKNDIFSRGCYTYVPIGASGKGYENLSHPILGHGYGLLFGGEHTNKEHPDTIGGAMITGIREGKRALHLLYGEEGIKRKVETPSVLQRARDQDVSKILFAEAEAELKRRRT